MSKYPQFKFKVPSPLSPAPEIVAVRVVAFVVIVAIATWGMSKFLVKRQGKAIVAPQYMVAAPATQPDVHPMMFVEKSSTKPLSTPTTLGSRYGLGGGPLVGSQSLRLGGSTFLPGRNVASHGEAQYDERPPFNVTWSTPSSSTFAPPMTSRIPGRKLVSNDNPGNPVTPPAPPATVPPPSPSAAVPSVVVDEVVPTNAETPPVVLAAAPLSNGKLRGSYFVGAPTSPNQIPEGMVVNTRDGKIIQPR